MEQAGRCLQLILSQTVLNNQKETQLLLVFCFDISALVIKQVVGQPIVD